MESGVWARSAPAQNPTQESDMQSSLKSIVSRAFVRSVRAAQTSREIGAPQPLPAHLHQYVGGGVAAPKSGWSVDAPKSGW